MSLNWNLEPPPPSEYADREIHITGKHLSGKRIALLITGSIAAYRMPDLIRDFRREGADVVVYATTEGLRYVAREALEWCSQNPVIDGFTSDAEHLSDSTPFDVFVVAPASYNTLNKAASGIADSVVTAAIAAALGRMERQGIPVLFAPAMHGAMHNSILTSSMQTLQKMGVTLIPPQQTHGKNNLASLELIVAATIRTLSKSPLRGKSMLITGGPTPVPLDNIRRITTRFSGALSIQLAREAWLRGASVELILGKGSRSAPDFLQAKKVATYDDYCKIVNEALEGASFDWGVFTAAVADYQPESVYDGKIASNQQLTLKLLPTQKLIDEVRKQFPALKMVSFKYEENVSHQELISIAEKRLSEKDGSQLIVANRAEEFQADGTQVAWLLDPNLEPQKFVGKEGIANALLDRIEQN
ncbi:MAG: bifunctional phosphopantothenoylcysteine decarboxylase/phosphopantothenate--cysteine ligase CoaBC [SAR324 cluster bacterium]|nr:bifunctional phosphopantothenoylcysteine decarboxylase/phosphopantothenate--cysteine ligase CoaBC [SAR324 cluster bacterium]MBL7035804.1 bifunctional phosphopantothenoylcysteine decarboxylase/phosphopantothenate--cysteine ligase CoaBC [SAR324 cluster bacterium]